MNFFAHQDEARKTTRRLVVLFALAVAAVVVAVHLTVAVLLFGAGVSTASSADGIPVVSLWDPELLVGVTLATLLVITGGSLFKTWQLRSGGPAVARLLGGRQVHPNTDDPEERRLLNVVEEMAIASGTPVPDVYLMDDERGINAFAAGHSPEDTVIGVTRGAVHLLSRDELQGVIAHEFSHILHGDLRIDLRLMGLVHGILVISAIGYLLMRSQMWGGSRRRKGGGASLALVGLALYAIGWIGVFFGRLIKAAVSRQREFLADAAAVQYTRNPLGIGGALKKIGGFGSGSRMKSPKAEEASHLFFADGLRARWFGMTATHPPLGERIRRIDPSFDGTFTPVRWEEEAPASGPEKAAVGRTTPPPIPGTGAGPVPSPFPTGADFAAAAGTLQPMHLAWAAALLEGLPGPLSTAAREPASARSLIYALLLDRDPAVRFRQDEALERQAEPGVKEEVYRLLPLVEQAGEAARVPLADLALPALRRVSPGQYATFRRTVQGLAEADHRLDLFEYALKRMILRHLEPRFASPASPEGKPAKRAVQFYALRGLADEISCLVSMLAHAGSDDGEAARAAVTAAAAKLQDLVEIQALERDACRLSAFDAALDRLDQAAPRLKERVLQAAVAAVVHDRRVTTAEAELLRAVADGLGCPVPPMLSAATG